MNAARSDTTTAGSAATSAIEACPNVMRRFETIKNLTDGYFHDIRGLLSVIMGQAGVLDSLAARPHRERTTDAIRSGTEKIETAADDLVACLTQLRELCSVGEDDLARMIPASVLIGTLPSVIRGYNRQIKDTKNISFDFEVDNTDRPECIIARRDIFDYVYLFLTSLMSEAICSGSFDVSLDVERGSVVVRFERKLIGHLGVEEVVGRLFGHHDAVDDEQSRPCPRPIPVEVSCPDSDDSVCEVSFPILQSIEAQPASEKAGTSPEVKN